LSGEAVLGDDVAADVAEQHVVAAGVAAEGGRTRRPWRRGRTGRGPLRLLDDHAAVRWRLQLFGDDLGVAYGAFLQDADGGDVVSA
jgi:hypothetical protein